MFVKIKFRKVDGMAKKDVVVGVSDDKKAVPPVNIHYTRSRIAAQNARKEAQRPGSSKPAPR